jgi:hypothetical protein
MSSCLLDSEQERLDIEQEELDSKQERLVID